jgi:translation initiation factor 5B
MTKKQKEEQRIVELRKQALLASGVQIEGLQASGSGAPGGGKKVVYGNRKKDNKKGPAATGSKDASPAPSAPATPVVASKELPTPEPEAKPEEEEKDEWDASSEDEAAPAPAKVDVKDDWDASSEEEEAAKPAAAAPTKGMFSSPLIYPRGSSGLQLRNRRRPSLRKVRLSHKS